MNSLCDKVIPITSNIKRHINELEKQMRACPQSEPFIHIKNPSILKEVVVVPWHPNLIEVVSWVSYYFKGQVVITSAFRKDDFGIHGAIPLRACDLRSRYFDNPKEASNIINNNWDYGKVGFNVCLYHRVGVCIRCKSRIKLNPDIGVTANTYCNKCKSKEIEDLGPHFHIQARDETRRREA